MQQVKYHFGIRQFQNFIKQNTFPIAITPHRPAPMEASPLRKLAGNSTGTPSSSTTASSGKARALIQPSVSFGFAFQLTRKTMSPCAPEHLSLSLSIFRSDKPHDSARFRSAALRERRSCSRPSQGPRGRVRRTVRVRC